MSSIFPLYPNITVCWWDHRTCQMSPVFHLCAFIVWPLAILYLLYPYWYLMISWIFPRCLTRTSNSTSAIFWSLNHSKSPGPKPICSFWSEKSPVRAGARVAWSSRGFVAFEAQNLIDSMHFPFFNPSTIYILKHCGHDCHACWSTLSETAQCGDGSKSGRNSWWTWK